MNAVPQPSQYVSAAELAAEFNLPHPRHLVRMAKAGKFPQPAVKFGARMARWSRAQVQAWLDAQAGAGTHVGGQK